MAAGRSKITFLLSTLLTLPTKTDTFANRVDPDETNRKSCLIRIYIVCHSVFFFILDLTSTPPHPPPPPPPSPIICSNGHVQIQGRKYPLQTSGLKGLKFLYLTLQASVLFCNCSIFPLLSVSLESSTRCRIVVVWQVLSSFVIGEEVTG